VFAGDSRMRSKSLAGVILSAWVLICGGCGADIALVLPNESAQPVDTDRYELIARFVQISDTQIVDEESPGRLTVFAHLSGSAWRAQEAYSLLLLDGTIRAINKLHVARHPMDFLVHTGDSLDNAQFNELKWFLTVFDGGLIDPRSGPDDREPSQIPDPLLDPHHPFETQGLYRRGVHGGAPTIPWYVLFGNHDRFAVGILPIVTDLLGQRTSPLPLEHRPGLFFPLELDPTGFLSWAPITPANPGPPPEINLPSIVTPNPDRRFITDREFVDAHLRSTSDPPGHGFNPAEPDRSYYSVSPVPGLKLIALNSAAPFLEKPGLIYPEGAISFQQLNFLEGELRDAQTRGECVVVASHHPSSALNPAYGTALTAPSLRALLNSYPCAKLHIAGHTHGNAVFDRGGYLEIVTGSILDAPQQGRIIEIWRPVDPTDGDVEIRYRMFSHLDEITPLDDSHSGLFLDPLLPMRRTAAELAGANAASVGAPSTGG